MSEGWLLGNGVCSTTESEQIENELSSMQLDGSQTSCKKKGEYIGYLGCKATKTTNAHYFYVTTKGSL